MWGRTCIPRTVYQVLPVQDAPMLTPDDVYCTAPSDPACWRAIPNGIYR
jgi:hypothetical protein